ncbi:MAG TPA: vitamin K epoxide reductase family protein [Candidatus Saccharimonadales bacterium]|nr:vitamin K epoxide reductase family protein [Candidatus Saccharimonadales bacterium]
MARVEKQSNLVKALPWIFIVGGIIGIISSFVITLDKFKLAENPNYIPSCNLNPIVSCGSVMASHQGSAFGFPNPFIGLAAFAVLITIGMAMLAGATFKKWFWIGLELGSIFGLLFVHWLFYESVYRIHALCPYCMAVWVVVIVTFWYVSLYVIEAGFINLKGSAKKVADLARSHHIDIVILWLLIIAALILKHFWYYYHNHLF